MQGFPPCIRSYNHPQRPQRSRTACLLPDTSGADGVGEGCHYFQSIDLLGFRVAQHISCYFHKQNSRSSAMAAKDFIWDPNTSVYRCPYLFHHHLYHVFAARGVMESDCATYMSTARRNPWHTVL